VAEIGLATADDAELIGVAITCISEGIDSKMLLARAISERSGVSRVTALNLLERYTGDDPVLHRWQFNRGAHGRQEYSLLVSAPDNGPPVTSREHDDLC